MIGKKVRELNMPTIMLFQSTTNFLFESTCDLKFEFKLAVAGTFDH